MVVVIILFLLFYMDKNYMFIFSREKPKNFSLFCRDLMYEIRFESVTFPLIRDACRKYSFPLLCGRIKPVCEILYSVPTFCGNVGSEITVINIYGVVIIFFISDMWESISDNGKYVMDSCSQLSSLIDMS